MTGSALKRICSMVIVVALLIVIVTYLCRACAVCTYYWRLNDG